MVYKIKFENILNNIRDSKDSFGISNINEYSKSLGLNFEIGENGPFTKLSFKDYLVGNPLIPALHGGVIAGLLENASLFHLLWTNEISYLPRLTHISFEFLSTCKTEDTFASCRINRKGKNIVNMSARAWQKNKLDKVIATSNCSYLVKHKEETKI